MSSFPPPGNPEPPPFPVTDPGVGIPDPIPPDGPSIGPADPVPSPDPGEIPEGPDEGGEEGDFPDPQEVDPSGEVDVSDAGDGGWRRWGMRAVTIQQSRSG